MLKLAVEWGKVDKLLPRVEMLPGENHRDRVLTAEDQTRYLNSASTVGDNILDAHRRALKEFGPPNVAKNRLNRAIRSCCGTLPRS